MASAVAMNEDGGTINRLEIQAAIAKAVELRALHAALMQDNNTANLKLLLPSSASPPPPLSRPVSQFSAHDYPVFTPSYGDKALPGYAHLQAANIQNYYITAGSAADDARSIASSCTNNWSLPQNSPGIEIPKSRRRNSLGDFPSVSSCNNCKPATVIMENDNDSRSVKHSSNIVVPVTESHTTLNHSQAKSRGLNLSWLVPRLRRRHKNGNSSPVRAVSEHASLVLKDIGTVSIETLKKELIEANQKKDAALTEVSEMRSSFVELRKKLETLESYCEELKKGLRQTADANSISKRGKLSDGRKGDDSMPVSEEVMTEGFLQIVSETRLSVKQFCKTLFEQIDENDEQLIENLNLVLKPYKLSLSSRYSKLIVYHLEAIVNQAFYEDFENCVFQRNGTPTILDPAQDRQAKFQSFAALRNLSWNEILRKGTKYYSEELSEFCDSKMRCIITALNWTTVWSEKLLESFFVAGKCIWLLHLLAFSFCPPLMILRVDENRSFDGHFMEDIGSDKQKGEKPSRVKVMITPGFYVQDKILRCKVICRYKTGA